MTGSSQENFRDEELGTALRELDVPGHAPGFYRELERRLAAERRTVRRGRRARLRWGAGVGLAAAVAAALVLAIGIPSTGSGVASAAEIKAQVQGSLTTLRNLSGVLVDDGPGRGDESRSRFVLTVGGDFRLAGPGAGELMVYDAGAGVVRSAQRSASLGGGPLFYAERRGVAPGPPDPGPPTWALRGEFGMFLRALLAAEDPRVREIAYEGRPAWRLDVDVVPNAVVPDFSGDRLELTVDRETGLPVRVVERKQGAFLRELRIEEFAVDAELPPATFRFDFPAGAEVMRSDDGFRRVALDAVRGVVGYAPLAPAWMPDGFRPAEVAVAEESGPTGTEGGNPPSRMVVSLSYRRGLDLLLVTTRLAGGERWGDPLATGEGFRDQPERLALGDGALAGRAAELLIAPRGIPHLWALADDLVVTVGGDLSRTELIRVAESLRRR
jgi:outer membrane lipoprotein-sorting protein